MTGERVRGAGIGLCQCPREGDNTIVSVTLVLQPKG